MDSRLRAIIIAARRGDRLAEFDPKENPKCLLTFGGRSLLARHLDLLYKSGVMQVDLVVGDGADQVIEHVGRLSSRPDVAFHYNPRDQQGSVASLGAAREALESGTEVLLMDADVLYHPHVLQRLVQSRHSNCFLLDRDFRHGAEPVKIAISGGIMVDFGKQLANGLKYDLVGQSVGFFRFGPMCSERVARECARFEAEGLADAPQEEVLRNLLIEQPETIAYEDVSGLPWAGINSPADVIWARNTVLPAIQQDFAGF